MFYSYVTDQQIMLLAIFSHTKKCTVINMVNDVCDLTYLIMCICWFVVSVYSILFFTDRKHKFHVCLYFTFLFSRPVNVTICSLSAKKYQFMCT